MSEKFDPLHLWLGISKEEQPPNYYRLLGLEPFEEDGDVIQNAAERQQMHVRSVAKAEHQSLAKKLLAGIQQAELTLLTPDKRTEYDSRLRAKLAAATARKSSIGKATPGELAKPPVEQKQSPAKPSFDIEASDPRLSKLRKHTPKAKALPESAPASNVEPSEKKSLPIALLAGVGGGAVALVLILVVVVTMMSGGDKTELAQADQTTDAAAQDDRPFQPGSASDTGKRPAQPGKENPDQAPTDNNPNKPPSGAALPTPGGEPATLPVPGTNPNAPGPNNSATNDSNSNNSTNPPPFKSEGSGDDPTPDEPPKGNGPQLPTVGGEPDDLPSAIPQPTEPAEPERHPLPETARLESLTQEVEDLFEISTARTAEDRVQKMERLLEQAEQSKEAPAERYAMLTVALEQAKAAAELRRAFQIVEQLAADYQLDPLPQKANILATVRPVVSDQDANKERLDLASMLMQQAASADRFEQAIDFVDVMLDGARRLKNGDLIKQIAAIRKQLGELAEEQETISLAMTKLEEYADDPAENLKVGKYLCLERGEWLRGLPNLAKGADPALAKVARQELSAVETTDQQVDLADAWWALAEASKRDEEANALRHRAIHWYRTALVDLTGLERTKVDRLLKNAPPLKSLDQRRNFQLAPLAGLLVHYPFDAVRGSLTQDVSGNSQHGQLLNAPTLVREGAIGSCLKLNATGQAVRLTKLPPLPKLTVAMWVYNAAPETQKYKSLFNQDQWSPNSFHFQLSGNNGLNIGIHGGGNNHAHVNTANDVSRPLGWQHLAVTVDVPESRLMVYADGSLIGAGSVPTHLVPTLSPGQIGSWRNVNDPRSLTGMIDDFRIYNRALTAEEIGVLASMANVQLHPTSPTSATELAEKSAALRNQPFLAYIYVRNRTYKEYGGTHNIPLVPGPRCRLWQGAPKAKPGSFGLEMCDGDDRNWTNLRLMVEPIERGKFLVRCVGRGASLTYDLLGADGRLLVADLRPQKSAVVEMPQK